MRDHLSFVLNGEVLRLKGVDPAMPLLAFLRRERRLTGAKEGCAEGDCGACTVAVGELPGDGDGVRQRALGACILLLGMLEGRSVTTVERLRGAAGPHAVQQAMVAAHAAQCGFCTPGIVMSLYAAHLSGCPAPAKRLPGACRTVDDLLSGNLCRCTGYGPIISAAHAVLARPPAPEAAADLAREAALLKAIAHAETVVLDGAGTRFHAPASLDALATLCVRHPDAVILSGATDVGLRITKQHRRLATLIYTGRVRELQAITRDGDTLRIGAGARWDDVADVLGAIYPDLAELIRRFGSVQVRGTATIGGNIANGSPVGDGPPALIALGARIVLRQGATRRTLPLEDVFIAYGRQDRRPGELVEAIEVPLASPPGRLRCYKVSKRFDQDISAVCGAFNIDTDGGTVRSARIAFGGMAGTPRRAAHVEAALTGQPWTRATVMAALPAFAHDYAPITDVRASAAYRLQVAGNLLIRYFHETEHPLQQSRLVGREAAF